MSESSATSIDGYLPVRVCTFRGDQKVQFDIFIYLRGKHVHYVRKGESFESSRLTNLREKKLKKLWIKPEDEKAYRSYIAQSWDTAFQGDSGREVKARAEVIHGACQSVAEDLIEFPHNETFLNTAVLQVGRIQILLKSEPEVVGALLTMTNVEKDLGFHSASVAVLAMALGLRLKLESQLTTIGIGALVHDLGHWITGADFTRDVTTLPAEEQIVFKTHPQLGYQKIRGLPYFDPDIKSIILKHEETCNGTGFPDGLHLPPTESATLVVGVANCFDRLVQFRGMAPSETMKHMLSTKVGSYPIEYLSALKSVLTEHSII